MELLEGGAGGSAASACTIMIRDVSMVAFSEPEALKQEVSANRHGRGEAKAGTYVTSRDRLRPGT